MQKEARPTRGQSWKSNLRCFCSTCPRRPGQASRGAPEPVGNGGAGQRGKTHYKSTQSNCGRVPEAHPRSAPASQSPAFLPGTGRPLRCGGVQTSLRERDPAQTLRESVEHSKGEPRSLAGLSVRDPRAAAAARPLCGLGSPDTLRGLQALQAPAPAAPPS